MGRTQALQDDEQQTLTWIWWSSLLVIAASNCVLYALAVKAYFKAVAADREGENPSPGLEAPSRWTLLLLAFPFVLESNYRCVFPGIYTERVVLWDTPLNSIAIDRTLACIGEICWGLQYSILLNQLNRELAEVGSKPSRVVQVFSYLIPAFVVGGEYACLWEVATTNNLYCVYEVVLWFIQYLMVFVAAGIIWYRCWKVKAKISAKGKGFLGGCLIIGAIYVPYDLIKVIPMYIDRYNTDQANHVKYYGFWEGLKDAATRREVHHDWQSWSDDWLWMVFYYSVLVWTAVFMTCGIRLQYHRQYEPLLEA